MLRAALRRSARGSPGPRPPGAAAAGGRPRRGDRVEPLADRLLLYADDGDAALPAALAAGRRPGRPPWCGAARWRTSSSGSPAGRWWTDGGRARRHADPSGARAVRRPSGSPPTATLAQLLVSSLLEPVLFLAAMGLGLGRAGRPRRPRCPAACRYLTLLAPGLLAASARCRPARPSRPTRCSARSSGTSIYRRRRSPPRCGRVTTCRRPPAATSPFRVTTSVALFLAVHRRVRRRPQPAGRARAARRAAHRAGLRRPGDRLRGRGCENDSGFAGLHRFVRAPAVPVLRHVLPGRPAARRGSRPVAYATPLWHGVALSRGAGAGHPGRRRRPCCTSATWSLLGRGSAVVRSPARLIRQAARSRDRARTRRCCCGPARLSRCVPAGRRRCVRAQPAGGPPAAWLISSPGSFEPLFYLLSIGIGLGRLVGQVRARRRRRQLPAVRGARRCWPRRR